MRIVSCGKTVVVSVDEKVYGAHHEYRVYPVTKVGDESVLAEIHFQKGPIKEVGLNGCQNEDLLDILIDRLSAFQVGAFACEENENALSGCRFALANLWKRTANRLDRGVEGQMQK